MTLQDDFVTELQHAAARVGPVPGLDGREMGRRAVRRGRVRRGALTGVGALAAVGAVAGAWLVAAPSADTVDPASAPVPDGWTPASVGGLRLAVPPGLEPDGDGVWQAGPEGGQDFVHVQPAGEDLPIVDPGSRLTPVDVEVPGAESAEYVVQTTDDPTMVQDFLGKLQVHLETGETVQVTLVWVDADEGAEVFDELVGSVVADDATDALPSPDAAAELQPLGGFVAGVPEGWQEADFAGLDYALPPGWTEDETPVDAYALGSLLRATSADGTSRISVVQAVDTAGWPESIAPTVGNPASTFPLEGADVVQVDPDSTDGTYGTTTHVRREGGRAYTVTTQTPDTAGGRTLTRQLLGTLGLAAESQSVPGPDDLPQLETSPTPADWTEVHQGALRLAVPPAWTDLSVPDLEGWASEAGTANEEQLSVSSATLEDDTEPTTPYGYTHDVPGAEHVVVQVYELPDTGSGVRFLGTVGLYRGDELVTLEYSGPWGDGSRERFGQIVQSFELEG